LKNELLTPKTRLYVIVTSTMSHRTKENASRITCVWDYDW